MASKGLSLCGRGKILFVGMVEHCTLLTQNKFYLAPLLSGSVHSDMVAHMATANGSGIGKPPTPPPPRRPRRCSPFLQSTQSMLMRPRPAAFRCTVEQLDSFLTLGLLLNVLKSFQVIVNFTRSIRSILSCLQAKPERPSLLWFATK